MNQFATVPGSKTQLINATVIHKKLVVPFVGDVHPHMPRGRNPSRPRDVEKPYPRQDRRVDPVSARDGYIRNNILSH